MDKAIEKAAKELKARLAALDFGVEQNVAEGLKAEIDKVAAAIDRTDHEICEISRQIFEGANVGGDKVADAMLNGGDGASVEALAPSRETLESRRHALREGRIALVDRQRALRDRESEVERVVATKCRDAAKPFVEQAMRRQKEAAGEFAGVYAALAAISASGAFEEERNTLRRGVDGLVGDLKILPSARSLAVPPEVLDALAALEDKPLVRRWGQAQVPAP